MKKSVTFCLLMLIASVIAAQSPQAFKYQAVARDLNGDAVINQDIAVKISILSGSETGPVVYSELHEIPTNQIGLFTLEIGNAIFVLSGNFTEIGWGVFPHFLKTEIDITGGSNYLLMGVSQLLSVPYALYANEAGNAQNYVAGSGINVLNGVISNTSPDQTVVLTGGTGIGTSGTYPNLTVSNTLPNATHTGDATGGSSLTVGKIQGRSIATTAPSNGEVLQWNMFSLKWEPATDDNTTYTAGSGINVAGTVISNTSPDQTVVLTGGTGIGTSGTYPNFTVTNILPNATHTGDATGGSSMIVEKIRGHTVSSIAPTNNQILQWNGSAWTPTTLATPSQDWTLYGNAGTSSVAHFIGTTDNKALKFKVNNQKAGWLDPSMLANTSFGYQALNAVSGDGTDNTALGYKALYSNTTGAQNIAVGRDAIYSNLTGISNIAIGCYALHENNDGDNNLAIGNFSLHDNTIGKNNTAIGNDALIDNVDGEYNTATGVDAMGQNTTGDFNTGIGYFALNNNSTGSYNTAIGCASYFSGSPNNSTSLGNEAGIGIYGNNKVAIGNTSVSWIGGQVGWSTFSDGRINDNVKQDVAGLDFINRLRPITYNLNIHRQNEMCGKDEKKSGDWPEKYDIEKMRMTGFIAQEVEKAAQDAGYDFSGIDKPVEGGLYSLRYSDFVVPLVKAVQEQQVIIDNQQKQIEELMKRIEILENK